MEHRYPVLAEVGNDVMASAWLPAGCRPEISPAIASSTLPPARPAPFALWDWDVVRDELYFSPRWMEMAGLCSPGVVGTLAMWLRRVLPADRPALQRALAEQLDGGHDRLRCEYRLMHTDGSLRRMLVRAAILRSSPGGRAVRLSGVQHEVKELPLRPALSPAPALLFAEPALYGASC